MEPFRRHFSLPLVPVADLVHFPRTTLILDLAVASHRQLVRDLLAKAPEDRLVGVVLQKPATEDGQAAIFAAGTCARVLRVEPLGLGGPDEAGGGPRDEEVRLYLEGTCRFAIQEETRKSPYLEALVTMVEEPALDEGELEVREARRRLGERLVEAHAALGEACPMTTDEIRQALDAPFEELVNRVAHSLDVPALRKLELLSCPLPERAMEVLGILRSRIKLQELLAPFRHLEEGLERN
jgi:Lon protease-like protein